jgi:hypothetical protein
MLPFFKDWPASAITVEFWMWSVDNCREGVPISYATGGYEKGDNTFLIFNYNDWCVPMGPPCNNTIGACQWAPLVIAPLVRANGPPL